MKGNLIMKLTPLIHHEYIIFLLKSTAQISGMKQPPSSEIKSKDKRKKEKRIYNGRDYFKMKIKSLPTRNKQ